ncbi:alpha/beta hydrolase fold protein [Streptomyces hygroscopicus subsp. jinggangensis 5008]|nr:alpha/beta hydrolase fold protein [Streptomyces hygroscopicus subsp. jinggangensis 5008]
MDEFEYSFEHLTSITLGLLNQLGLRKFALYIQDYGAPIGLRIASREPDRVTALLVQSGNAYMEGFTPFWDILFAHAQDREANEKGVRKYLDAETTRWQYTHGVPADRLDRLSPETWTLDQALLDRTGNDAIQLQLFWDYQFNVPAYPGFQEYFRRYQPPTLITWGEHDEIFGAEGARAYARDLPGAEIHLLDAGHFALESHGAEIAALIRDFLGRVLT